MALRNMFGDIALEETQSVEVTDLLHSILLELRIMNKHLETLSDIDIKEEEVEDERY